jgi:hypothetical protein
MLVRFELSDREQITQVVEAMAQGEPGELSKRLGDETCGFIRAAVTRKLDGCRAPSLRRANRLPFAGSPAQLRPIPRISIHIPSMRAQPKDGILQLFRY